MNDLESKSRNELVEIAKSLGIKSVTILRKEQLIEQIIAVQQGHPTKDDLPNLDTFNPFNFLKKRGRPKLEPKIPINPDEPVQLSLDDLIPIHKSAESKETKDPKSTSDVEPITERAEPQPAPKEAREAKALAPVAGVFDESKWSRQKYFKDNSHKEPLPTTSSMVQEDPVPMASEPAIVSTSAPSPAEVEQAPSSTESIPRNMADRRPHQGGGHRSHELIRYPGAPRPLADRPDPLTLDLYPSHGKVRFNETEQLPESDAPTLSQRLEDIKPYLGGFIIAEGTLEIMKDGYGFLRSVNYGYASSPDDIYISAALVKRNQLRAGDCIVGVVRPPRADDRYFAMVRVDGINGKTPDELVERKDFEDLLPIYPDQRFKLETVPNNYLTRIIDLFSPLGKGQRGLIVAQPKTGKTTILRNIANAVSDNNPETRIIILLIDERPEEVTEMERGVTNAEVIASTFDMRPENHIRVAEIVFDKARRLVECGQDVLILMDSITRLSRAYNICASNTGRTMSGGIDAQALKAPRQLFSSARNVEGGGSLTIIATALIETGSRMDDVIFEEFKGTGNMEIVLDRRLADRRIYPAIDVFKSGTRREELLGSDEEREKVVLLRRYLASMNPVEAVEFLLDKMKGTYDNRHFLISMNQ